MRISAKCLIKIIYIGVRQNKPIGNIKTWKEQKMNSNSDKSQENNSQSVANQVSQKKSGSETAFQFVDNRPEAIAQRKLQEMANNSPQVKQLQAIQTIADNSPQAKKAAQLQAMANNYPAKPIQKKKLKKRNCCKANSPPYNGWKKKRNYKWRRRQFKRKKTIQVYPII